MALYSRVSCHCVSLCDDVAVDMSRRTLLLAARVAMIRILSPLDHRLER